MKLVRPPAFVLVAMIAVLASPVRAHASLPRPQLPAARAASFAISIVELMGEGRYAEAWLHLHPAHQVVAPFDVYVACEQESPLPHVAKVRVARVTAVWVAVPGISARVAGPAVDLLTTFRQSGLDPYTVRHTVHVVAVDGRPVWILPLARFRLYADGGCQALSVTPLPQETYRTRNAGTHH